MEERGTDLPLAGISVLVTRAREQSAGLVEELALKGARVTVIPAVSVTPIPEPEGFARAMDRVGIYENVILTSVNGVEVTVNLLREKGMGPWDLPPALCVGEKTAGAWEEAGGEVAAVPGQFTAEALLELLGEDLAGHSFLIMRPEVVKTELGGEMSGRGADVDEVVIYRTVIPEEGGEDLKELMSEGGPDVILFASPSAIDGIFSMAARRTQGEGRRTKGEERNLLDIPAICIGPTTARAAEEAGFTQVYFPDEHTAEGMVNELLVIAGALKRSVQF